MSKSYEVIFENNQQWLETKKQQHPEYFTELADGQNPRFSVHWMLRQPRGCRGSDVWNRAKCSFIATSLTW